MSAERQLIEKAAEAAIDAVGPLGKKLVEAANQQGQKRGIDGKYVQFVLDKDVQNWPRLPGRHEEALLAMTSLARENYAFHHKGFTMPPIEKEDLVNDAVVAVGDWAWEFRPILRRTYVLALKPFVGQAKAYLNATEDRTWSDRDSFAWLHASVKDAAGNDPLGIYQATLLHRIADLIG